MAIERGYVAKLAPDPAEPSRADGLGCKGAVCSPWSWWWWPPALVSQHARAGGRTDGRAISGGSGLYCLTLKQNPRRQAPGWGGTRNRTSSGSGRGDELSAWRAGARWLKSQSSPARPGRRREDWLRAASAVHGPQINQRRHSSASGPKSAQALHSSAPGRRKAMIWPGSNERRIIREEED